MRLPDRVRPGAGFVALGVTSLSVALFLVWGLGTPPLDEVWRMQIEMGLRGVEPLTPREFRLLQTTLRRYPALANNMLEDADAGLISANQDGVVDIGYAYLVRKDAGAPARLQVQAISDTVRLGVRTLTASAEGGARPDSVYRWQVPNEGPFPQLIEVRLTGQRTSRSRRSQRNLAPKTDDELRSVVVTLTP